MDFPLFDAQINYNIILVHHAGSSFSFSGITSKDDSGYSYISRHVKQANMLFVKGFVIFSHLVAGS